ncbi:hypothetical protein ANN_24750 [Periplaneta americana]|uniref:Uncharacterized protein n=1 Tax=Periplaneta americana TaxID=6978 RepID=A0ABQ8RZH3_PERAM|nr:hypothetical protein ANN_24750 [Periplaneta americana]
MLRNSDLNNFMKERHCGSVAFCLDLQQVQNWQLVKLITLAKFHFIHCASLTFPQSPQHSTYYGVVPFFEGLSYELDVTCIRLFCDGYSGQNKNMHIVHALCFWLQSKAPPHISEVVVHFPVRGHSFLLADRLFGVVEKTLCKKAKIITPNDYRAVYETVDSVKNLGEN